MATFLGSPSILARPLKRLHLSYSQAPRTPGPPPPHPPSQEPPPLPPPSPQLTPPLATPSSGLPVEPKQKPRPGAAAAPESTDWVASSLSRRFGLGAGLAWAGFLAVGVLSEQIKTRLEASKQEADTKDVEEERELLLPNGIRYYEVRVGGGPSPMPGDLVVIDLKGTVQGSGEAFVDTFAGGGKPLALVLESRPYTRGMCEGVESALRLMRAGGRSRVVVPPALGFGDKGADLGSGIQIPPSSTLEFVVQVDKVSIAPS
uniref:peptidylprolyl isomerase n=1 Tax=Anthurium amnicola TaxID=1678845 RepID=A0A1D1XGJ3_9ARAE